MPVNLRGISLTRGRTYDENMAARVNDSLQYLPIKQRAAVLATMMEESGVDPLAKSANGTYQGLVQWGADRYRISSNDKEKELASQLQNLKNTLYNTTDHVSWTHGGEGSGYNSFREAYGDFHNNDLPLPKIYRALSYGYVRPQGKEDSYNNRLKVANQVLDRMIVGEVADAATNAISSFLGNKKDEGGFLDKPKYWNDLSMQEKSEIMKVAVQNGIFSLSDIKQRYNEFAEGGDINPAMTGMMKSELATAAQFGNPTARRMTNYDARSYTWPGEYEYINGVGEPKRGNGYVGSYGNLVTPQIQDTGNGLTFINNVWSPENDQRSYMQSLKFNNDAEAQYFGEHYKEVAPMMNLYSKGGHKIHIKPENRGKFTRLKERTGHSASWFKAHGTPAQKKMAIFALNSKHWKHGMGGNLFDGESQSTQQMSQSSWKQRHQAQWYGFLRNKGVSDADAQRLSGFFTAQDGLESAGGTSSAARKKNNYGGMQKGGKNIAYNTVQDYMEDKWKMMNNRFRPALSAKTVDEYATILGNPDTAGKGYLYYVTDSAPYNPNSPQWRAAQTQHMHNYINGMRRYAGMKSINFKNNPAVYAQLPERLPERPVDNTPLFMPSNPKTFFNIEQPTPIVIEEETNPVMNLIRKQQEPSEAELERAEQQENLRKFNLMMGLLNPQKESDSFFDTMGLLSAMANKNSYGGHIYDGTTEPTQQMNTYYGNRRVEPITGEAGSLGGITVYGKKPKYNYLKEWPGKTHPLTAGDAMKGIDAATGPLLHWMQPSQYIGAVREAANGKNPLVSMLRGNSGVVSEEYAKKYPWISTALNLGTDATVLGGPYAFRAIKDYNYTHSFGDPVIPKNFTENIPVVHGTLPSNSSFSFTDGKPEPWMYWLPESKSWNTQRLVKDLGRGIADARLFLGSEIKAASDAHNIELAKRIGYSKFAPYKNAQERASVYVKPILTADRSKLAGSIEKNINDPALDKMNINIIYDADKGGFHETLHRGNYGEEGYSFNPENMDFETYHQIQDDTRDFYNYKTEKLLVPKTEDNASWHDYMSRSAEAAVNSMEIGRRMGLKPGATWPGRKKAIELFEKYINSNDQKTNVFNVLNWRQKPRRVWDAITGRYFTLGTLFSPGILTSNYNK